MEVEKIIVAVITAHTAHTAVITATITALTAIHNNVHCTNTAIHFAKEALIKKLGIWKGVEEKE